MSTRVEVHPTAKIAAYALSIALIVSFGIVGAKRLLRSNTPPAVSADIAANGSLSITSGDLLLPVIELRIADAQLESHWSTALASLLSGQTEAPIEGGRVDVLTKHYVIEVDRLEKWHEAIGQAAHYALKTGKIPVVAIMLPSDLWPISPTTKARLLLIDETCTKQGIKFVLLHRAGANTTKAGNWLTPLPDPGRLAACTHTTI